MQTRKLLLIGVGLLAACAPAALPAVTPSPPPSASVTPIGSSSPSAELTLVPTLPPAATNVRVSDTKDYEFSQSLGFDGIPPVYDPRFVSAAQAPLLDDELVIGISLGGEAKAYPITVLRFREMVDDELAGIPILVTW